MNKIYVISWAGRDSDSGIWATYPVWDYGYFTTKKEAQAFVKQLNIEEPGEYDTEARAKSKYVVIGIEPANKQ